MTSSASSLSSKSLQHNQQVASAPPSQEGRVTLGSRIKGIFKGFRQGVGHKRPKDVGATGVFSVPSSVDISPHLETAYQVIPAALGHKALQSALHGRSDRALPLTQANLAAHNLARNNRQLALQSAHALEDAKALDLIRGRSRSFTGPAKPPSSSDQRLYDQLSSASKE